LKDGREVDAVEQWRLWLLTDWARCELFSVVRCCCCPHIIAY